MTQHLKNKHIGITRPIKQALKTGNKVKSLGGIPVFMPLLDISPTSDIPALSTKMQELSKYSLLILISPNAAESILPHLTGPNAWPAKCEIAVIGKGAAEVMTTAGYFVHHVPSQFDSEGLLALPRLGQVEGQKILIIKGNGGKELLATTLTQRGAIVDSIEAYQRHPSDCNLEKLCQQSLDLVMLTSSEGLLALMNRATAEQKNWLRSKPFVVCHSNVANTAKQLGFSVLIESNPGDDAMISAADHWFGEQQMSQETNLQTPSVSKSHRVHSILIGVLTIALAVSIAWQFQHQARLEQALGQKISKMEQAQTQNRQRIEESLAVSLTSQKTSQQLAQRYEALQSQQQKLETRYQALTHREEDWVLAEVEQTIGFAQQQLQLAGNVHAAIAALTAAEKRLQTVNLSGLLPLQRSVEKDLQTLRALPFIDISSLSLKLDVLVQVIDDMPLVIDHRNRINANNTNPAKNLSWQEKISHEFNQALGKLIQIRRIDQPDAALLSPEQDFFVRENLKLRLLDARLALMQRDNTVFKTDIQRSLELVKNYFETKNPNTIRMQQTLQQLQDKNLQIDLPDLSDTLNLIRSYNLSKQGVTQ